MADVVDVSNLTVNIIENNGSKTERTETPEEKKTAIENKNGALIYKEAFNGADLEYEVTSTRLKESIVVSEKQSEYSYSFDMNFDGLTPVIHSDGSIFLIEGNDTENPVFVIASPYMIDGNNEYSDMVEMRLTENGSLYTLIVTADSAWINSQDRAFPVVIDPTVIIDVGRRYIYDCYVDNSKPNKTFRVDDYLYAGMNGLGKTRTYVKYALPNLPDCSIVTAASLYLWQQDFDPGSGDTAYLNVYDCGDSGWNIDTITWNNQPISPSATVIDYTAFKANVNDVVAQYTFNITKIAKRWYEDGVNNGFMIASSNESVTKRTRFFSAENSQEAYPVTQIQYVNNTGIEDYWTYETIDLGRSGTAYISDYSGGLTYIHPNLNMSGYQMPLSISHVFNSDTTNSEDAYLNMRFGKSFRLNILERVIPVSQTGDDKPLYDAGYRYRLVDSDGTAHYYKTTATAGRFVHEFNDKNVLTKPATDSNNYYKITFEDGSGKTYGSDTCLRKITDKNGVSQTIAYAGGRITGVTDGAGRTATFTYNASNYLTSITDPAGRSTSFTYTDNWHLRSIVYPDGKATTFYYTSSGGKIAQIVTVDSSDILFTYKTVASKEKIFYRVTGAERRGKYESAIAGRQTLNKLTFQYRTGDTVVTDLNGNANYIIFDNAGRTIGTRDHSGALSTVRYNTIGNKNNKPDRSSDSFSNVFNLAENHSFERANLDYWTIYADSDYYTTGFLTSGAYMGHKALRLTMTQRGSVLFNQNFSNVSAGQKYTFSAYVKINGTLTNGVADLLIEAKNGGTILSSTRSTGITTTNNEWVRIQVNVTLPANCNLVRVYGAINNGTGTAYFDAVQMESGHAMNRYNLLENNGFNNVTSGNIDHWTFENCTSSDGPTINTNNNTNAARIYGNYTARKRVKQDVRINGKAGDTLVFGAWAKAACSAGGNNGTRKFGIIIDLYSGASLVQSGNAVFNEDAINSFQYVTGAITTTTAYDTVKYYLVYYNEVNSVIFENAHLYFDAYGSTYEYDSNGKLKLQKNGAGNAIKYTYNGPDITKIALEKDGVEKQTVIYTYDSKHNLLTAKTNRGVTTNYTYPSSGNKGLPISITVRSSDGTITSANSFVYSSNYNYLLSQTDARGNTTSYEYDNGVTPIKKGLLTKVTDPDGNATEYTYNANTDICTSVGGKPDAGTTVTNSYTFNSNYELTKINHNGFSYNFTYDAFGRPQQTKVNAQPLCTYAYNADGTLASETYGNGDVNSYAYDSLDRLISQSYNGTARYTYAYNAENQLARHQDSENGVVWTYGYDLAGRITEQDCSNKTAVRYTYDDTGNIGSYRVSKDSALLSGATYTYIQDSLLRTVTMNSMDNLVITYNYDGLNRCKSRVQTYNPAEPDNDIRTSYLYLEGAGSDTTGLIRYISYVKYNSNVSQGPIKPSFYYTYDNKGNILTVKEGNVLKVTYTYDGLSRLVREDNVWLDKSVTYTYDNGGNILNKKYYAYTTGELSSVLDTVDYTYDSVWKDKLTSYNGGSTITYDEIGNPLTYRGYNLTWVKGRQLRLVQGNGVSQIYNYNADGLRTRSYSGSKFKFTYYTYASGLLVSQTDGTNTLNFVYSPAGEALGFTCNGTKYFYMRNVQGDVIGIYDSTGTVVVEYTYDAWGKPNSVTGSLASTIGVINPLRYRGYYYDDETGFYYLQSRYYDPETGRFLNADGELAGVGESVQGYNLFAYCHNNPVNMSDPDGNWPKWLTGALNVVSGALQMAAGAALGATVGWTGVGAVAAGFLIVNGAATATQGVGQIVNDVTKSNVMREDNIVRTGVKSVGKEIEGKTGEKVAGFAYDTAVVAANLYAGKVGLEKSMPKIIESKVFSANNGYGFKLGKNIEMFYRNPNAAGGPGGTIFSYKGPLGKFRIDWDPAHSFHCHPPGH